MADKPKAKELPASQNEQKVFQTSKGKLTLIGIKQLLDKGVLHVSHFGDDVLKALGAEAKKYQNKEAAKTAHVQE